jgi:predicted nucleic acid-binding protein
LSEHLYVADTVALARYFEDSLPSKADAVFREAEGGKAVILVPEVVIGEFAYLALKGRIRARDPRATIRELLDEVFQSAYLRQSSMTREAWICFLENEIPELHDRIIYSIAVASRSSGILTNDEELKSSGVKTIW